MDDYIVLKKKDIQKYLEEDDALELDFLIKQVQKGRIKDKIDVNETFIVVGSKKPYYEEVKEIVDMEEYYLHY